MSFIVNPFVFGGGGGEAGTIIETLPSTTASTNNTLQAGAMYQAAQNLVCTGARVFGHAANTETARLWRVSDQVLLASASINLLELAWAEVEWSSPVALASGQQYVITIRQGSSLRRWRSADTSGTTFNTALATFVESRSVNSDAFPTLEPGSATVLGVCDLLVYPGTL